MEMEEKSTAKYWFIALLIIALGVISYFVFFAGRSAQAPDEEINGSNNEQTGSESSGKVFVDQLDIKVLESFPVRIMATVKGNLSDGCTGLSDITSSKSGSIFTITLDVERPEGAMCTQALVPFERTIELDVFALPAGTYRVVAQDKRAEFTLSVQNILEDKG